jgi:hypothetical protein
LPGGGIRCLGSIPCEVATSDSVSGGDLSRGCAWSLRLACAFPTGQMMRA